jgi:F-type H+-transporting ATPase subunit a
MFWLFSETAAAAETSHAAASHGAEASEHHMPILAELVNRYFGHAAYEFELKFTKPVWDKILRYFGTDAEKVFGAYTPENAIPWYTVMFILACILSVLIIWILKGQLSEEEPGHGQQTLEVGVLAVRGMLTDIVGPHATKYFPVVMTFAVLILISNLMGFFPLFMTPTAATSVTFALGLSSFLYYNYVGIKENGLLGHLGHLAGPLWWIAPLIFLIEVIGNLVRPMSLGIRLFGNMFADEKVAETVAGLYPPVTQFLVPVLLMPLALFVAFIQTFVFVLLSMIYLSEVSHPPHEEGHGAHGELHAGEEAHATAHA